MELLDDSMVSSIEKIVDSENNHTTAIEIISELISEKFDLKKKYFKKG